MNNKLKKVIGLNATMTRKPVNIWLSLAKKAMEPPEARETIS